MPVFYTESTRTFHLQTPKSSYIITVNEAGYLLHVYYGAALSSTDDVSQVLLCPPHNHFHPANPHISSSAFSSDLSPLEVSAWGCGDMRVPMLIARNKNGNDATDVRYVAHRIYPGKPSIPDMPSLRIDQDTQATTLEIDASDDVTGLQVTLYYTVFEQHDIITRRVRIHNPTVSSFWLQDVKSACIDFPIASFDLIHLWGDWGKERTVEKQKLTHGITTIASARGVSGHMHNPFIALAQTGATEESGEVYGFHLVYSGNFAAHIEVNAEDSTRVVMGINEQTFCWELQPGAVFDTPELIMVYASKGIGEMSRKLHRAYRAHLIPPHWRHTRRPLLINSWEAAYFDFDENKLYDFACRAHALGIEMLVMDDGWFGNRIDAKRALGDWTVNENKLHGGLKPLVDRIHALGMQFGIWFEPEMISPDSDLYRAHPDWCLHLPHREQSQARFQYVLDITRKDVRDHIWAQMDQILSSCRIDYVKWDFNRPFTEAGSTMLDAAHQGELNHRFTLGTYDLQHRLLTSYPDILLENCSGGGGRFDPAMLYFSPQIWCSDNTDPIERLSIQFGTSLCYPSESMGAHVSASPRANLKTKGNVALWGTHGYEMDPGRFTPQDESVVQEQVAAYHKYYDLVHTGDLYRLVSPNENAYYCAWELVAQDMHEALVTVVNMRQQPYHGRLLCLRGLDTQTSYRCSAPHTPYDGVVLSGAAWMHAGLNLCQSDLRDGQSEQYYFCAV